VKHFLARFVAPGMAALDELAVPRIEEAARVSVRLLAEQVSL
jgi:hypothetical protein